MILSVIVAANLAILQENAEAERSHDLEVDHGEIEEEEPDLEVGVEEVVVLDRHVLRQDLDRNLTQDLVRGGLLHKEDH